MSKYLLAFVFVLFGVNALAQTPQLWLLRNDSSYRNTHALIALEGSGDASSNVLDNQFVDKLLFGGYIDAAEKDRQMNRMSLDPRAGFGARAGFQFYNMKDSLFHRGDLGLTIGLSTEYAGYLAFHKNAFRTAFYGNTWAEGILTDVGPFYAEYQAFQKFSVGVFSKKNWSSIQLSLVSGNAYNQLSVNKATLYSSSDSLVAGFRGDYYRSDSSKQGFGTSNGIGVAVDFNANVPLADDKGIVSIGARNIGIVAWNGDSDFSSFNTNTTWTGIETDQMFGFNTDSLSFSVLKDSLRIEEEKKSMVRPLPATIQFRFLKSINKTLHYELGSVIRPNLASRPTGYVAFAQRFGDRFYVRQQLSIGGYSTWQAGAELQWFWNRGNGFLSIGSMHVPGFFVKHALGRDLRFSVSYFFKQSPAELVDP